ncbi:hypothetical protein [Sphingobium xanthum]|uniref:hypothetical protein n=2 Tax=Sphingobium TaxID=165695 RepID=UPI0015EB27B4|nr:hypothetical protein [Sphingobium xanthum]MCW2364370.1 hypothetical protein [Sphingobium sp. B10D3B]MCW2402233.1 hypothetical protein [Sphingobium sp. B10D7B]MCW2409212.1 hypothetical protein [Sphingobium xanthum]
MLTITVLLAAAAPPQDVVRADPVAGMLAVGIGEDEVAIAGITDTAVQKCVRFFEEELAPEAGMRIDRSAMTSSPEQGQIWRADAVSVQPPLRASRFTCTKDGKSIEPLGAPEAQ